MREKIQILFRIRTIRDTLRTMIDTHCHLNLSPLAEKAQEYYEKALLAGVEAMVVVGTDLQTSKSAIECATKFSSVFASIGIHPEEATPDISDEQIQSSIDALQTLLSSEKVVAIGECGLDYSRFDSNTWNETRQAQRKLFRAQAKLALKTQKALIIHCRSFRDQTTIPFDAYADLLDELEALQQENELPQFILHCASGSPDYISKAIQLGAYVSFAGNVTYPNAHAIRALLDVVPLDRLLVETDSPFLPPQSRRGQTNDPSGVMETARFIANTLEKELVDFDGIIDKNAHKAFRF